MFCVFAFLPIYKFCFWDFLLILPPQIFILLFCWDFYCFLTAFRRLVCMRSHFSRSCLFACQTPPSMGFSRQEYWSGLPFPSPGNLSDPGIEPMSLTSPALAGRFFTTSATEKQDLEDLEKNFWRPEWTSSFLWFEKLLLRSHYKIQAALACQVL